MIKTRLMEEADLLQVVKMEERYFSQPWSLQAFSDALRKEEYTYMVAAQGNEILAYCGMYQVLEEGNITQVAVREDVRGRGIGKILLQDFMQKGAEKGVEAYTLEVRVSNESAIRLYEKCGFVSECIRKEFYSMPKEDACIMWKR